MTPRLPGRPKVPPTLREDGVAGLVLGVQSVPDGLAAGLLAGLSPLAGLYGYMVGTLAGAATVSSAFMVVQGTGAMAMVMSDVHRVHSGPGAATALATLAVLTGIAMAAAGLLRLGTALRFVSNSVMVGFINAVGVNIVLGQLANLTGYAADGPNRVVRALNTLVSPHRLHWGSVAVGAATILLILVLERLGTGSLGLVIAIVVTSAIAPVLGWDGVVTLRDLDLSVDGLPRLSLPALGEVAALVVPALALAFVGLVQGAGVAAAVADPDGAPADVSRDFIGQGVANVASGLLQGMPVGGSMSASALNRAAGARSRLAALIAGLVMAVVAVALGGAVGYLAMPALAALLILIGVRTIKPADLRRVWGAGTVERAVLVVTFALTMLIPLQYAVPAGVGVSVILYVVRQSSTVEIRRQVLDGAGAITEVEVPGVLPGGEVVVLQPYGSLFFAAAPVFEAALPAVEAGSGGSVVILRLRGHSHLGTTFIEALRRYARSLDGAGSRLVISSANDRVRRQLAVTGLLEQVGEDGVYATRPRLGEAFEQAYEDAERWVRERQPHGAASDASPHG